MVWDSDPDFIEYELSPKKPRRQDNQKSKSSRAVKSHATMTKNLKLECTTPSLLPLVNPGSSSTSADANISGLPEFTHAALTSWFLLTLYHYFGNSSEPWKLFTKGNKMLSIIQEVINTVYPDAKYQAKWGDRICSTVQSLLFFLLKNSLISKFQVNSRLYSKQAFFSSCAVQVVVVTIGTRTIKL